MIFSIVSLLLLWKTKQETKRVERKGGLKMFLEHKEAQGKGKKMNAKLKKPCDAVTRKRL